MAHPPASPAGSSRTDFGPQLKSLSGERFTVVGWDPRGYGRSRPPDRDFPPGFFERDAKDAVDLMEVGHQLIPAGADLRPERVFGWSAGSGFCQVLPAGMERWRDHSPDRSGEEPR